MLMEFMTLECSVQQLNILNNKKHLQKFLAFEGVLLYEISGLSFMLL